MSISNRLLVPLMMSGLSLLAFPLVAGEAYKTTNSAQVLRAGEVVSSLKVAFDGVPGPPEKMRAIFHEELERRNFRLDPVTDTIMTIRWDGPFREDVRGERLRLKGRGGSQSRSELGFAIVLGTPAADEGEATYSLGASVADSAGDIWKGKVIAVTGSTQKSLILRRMIRQLLDTVGKEVAPGGALGEPDK